MRMFTNAAEREFDLVLFWSLDRFSREGVLKTLRYLQRPTNNGVEWWSIKEEYLRSLGYFRDAVLSILAVIASQERIRISERVKAGLDRAKAEGKDLGRPKLSVYLEKVRELRRLGLPHSDIGRQLGISRTSVGRLPIEEAH